VIEIRSVLLMINHKQLFPDTAGLLLEKTPTQ
jgi:hypothetical protein